MVGAVDPLVAFVQDQVDGLVEAFQCPLAALEPIVAAEEYARTRKIVDNFLIKDDDDDARDCDWARMAGLPGALLLADLAVAMDAAAVGRAPSEQNVMRKHHGDLSELTISHIETGDGNLLLVLVVIGILLLVAAVALVCACLARRADVHEYSPLSPCGKDTYLGGNGPPCGVESCLESVARSRACRECHHSRSRAGGKSHHHGRAIHRDSIEVCSECSKRNLPTFSSSDTLHRKGKKQVLRTEISLTKLGSEKPSKECAVQVELQEILGPGSPRALGSGRDGVTGGQLFTAHRREPETPETAFYSTASVVQSHSDGSLLVRTRSVEGGLRHVQPPAGRAKESSAGTELPVKRSPSTYQVLHVSVPHQFKPLSLRSGESKTKQGGSSEFQLTKGALPCEDDTSVLLRAETTRPAPDVCSSEEHSGRSEFTSELLPDLERLRSDSQGTCSSRGWRELRTSQLTLRSKDGDV